jgi:hypothetical protein
MNPSSRNRHRQPTRWVTGPGPYRHCIEAHTGWGIERFVRAIRCYRIVTIDADNPDRTAADPLSGGRHTIRADVRSNVSHVG